MMAAQRRPIAWHERLDALDAGEQPIALDPDLPYRDLLPERLRDAAVLVPVRPGPGGDEVVLTRRTGRLRHHAGQVSFPGGRVEPGDPNRLAAALREAREEIGLPAERVRPLGCLSPVLTISGFAMMPFVAEVEADTPLVACPNEVEEVFTIPFAFAVDPASFEARRQWHRGRMREFHLLRFDSHVIWGATAAVLRDLALRLAGEAGSK